MGLETIQILAAIISSALAALAALVGLRWLLHPKIKIGYDAVASLDGDGWIDVRIYNNRPNTIVIDGCWLVAKIPEEDPIHQQAILGLNTLDRNEDANKGAGLSEIAANGVLTCHFKSDFSNAALLLHSPIADEANEIENLKKRAAFFDRQERPSYPRLIVVTGRKFTFKKSLSEEDVLDLPIGDSFKFLNEMGE